VVIPTFWTSPAARTPDNLLTIYDHPTSVDTDGTLPACLESLSQVEGLDQVLIIVAATDPSLEDKAEDRVRTILGEFPTLDAFVFGPAELGSLHRRLEQIEFADMITGTSLVGYGAVRNVGLLAAGVLGCESVVFVDDDQIITERGFLLKAQDGLGMKIRGGKAVLAKSGYYTDPEGRYQRYSEPRASDVFWRKGDAFNDALAIVDAPPRIKPSPVAFGGCLALHRHMYANVSFDPWVVRGEDMDYVINARMHGGDVFIDGEWSVIHRPPHLEDDTLQFRQDIYRFVYEHRKIEFAKSQVDLRQVTPESLMPYPGSFIGSSFSRRAWMTAMMRGIARKDNKYFEIARKTIRDAQRYALENCQNYFDFQRRWPMLMDQIWDDVALKGLFSGERRFDRTTLTGRFPIVRDD
jgi:hypothetical protein